MVYWRGRPDGVVSVLLLPQRSRGQPRVGVLQLGHLLIDGGLRARFDATARLGLTGPTGKKTTVRRTSRVQVSCKSEFQTKLTVDKSKKQKKPTKKQNRVSVRARL